MESAIDIPSNVTGSPCFELSIDVSFAAIGRRGTKLLQFALAVGGWPLAPTLFCCFVLGPEITWT